MGARLQHLMTPPQAHRYGFSSTTTEREQAVHYAQGSASTVLELEMGMIDRGADIA